MTRPLQTQIFQCGKRRWSWRVVNPNRRALVIATSSQVYGTKEQAIKEAHRVRKFSNDQLVIVLPKHEFELLNVDSGPPVQKKSRRNAG